MGEDIDMTMKEFMVAVADRFEDMGNDQAPE